MKVLVALCVLALIALSTATSFVTPPFPHPRGCIYVNGHCQSECEEGTHSYTTGCGPKTPEATCDDPNPKETREIICDYTACYCDSPTVRDTVSGKCVALDKCPKK